ncbi:MAG: DUF721 domain-containing protein [Pirellulales bacterium]
MARRKAKANLPDARELDELQFQYQQRRPGVREPARWNNLLANLLARRGYGQLATADALADAWATAVGPELAGQTRPGRVQRGVLQVFVASSVVLQELTFRKQSLVAELVRQLPDHQIRDVRFRISAVS